MPANWDRVIIFRNGFAYALSLDSDLWVLSGTHCEIHPATHVASHDGNPAPQRGTTSTPPPAPPPPLPNTTSTQTTPVPNKTTRWSPNQLLLGAHPTPGFPQQPGRPLAPPPQPSRYFRQPPPRSYNIARPDSTQLFQEDEQCWDTVTKFGLKLRKRVQPTPHTQRD